MKKKRDITVIRPVKMGKGDNIPIKGSELISDLYARIFLSAPSNSGKTTVINHIVKNTIDDRTTVVIFSSTIDIDPIYVKIQEYLRKKKIPLVKFNSIVQNVDGVDINMLDGFLEEIEDKENTQVDEDEKDEVKEDVKKPILILTNEVKQEIEQPMEKKKKRKKVYHDRVPEYLFILDDLSKESLRSPSIVNFIKKSRHHRIRALISSQSIIHLSPDAFSQLTDIYIWARFSRDYLDKIHNKLNTNLTSGEFWALYLATTEKKYCFMNINTISGTIRQSFGPAIKY